MRISFLTAASERSSSGLAGEVSGPSFFGTSSFCGVVLVLLAMSLSTARARSRSCRAVDGLKGDAARSQNFIYSRTLGGLTPQYASRMHVSADILSRKIDPKNQ